jgi:elongator complex protein 2
LSQDGIGDPLSDDLLDAFEASLGDLTDAEEGGRQISLKRHILTVKSDQEGESSLKFTITFDALLVGHEAGITSLSWRPVKKPGSTPTLLSTSTDSSLILWSPSVISSSGDASISLWINCQRFGDIGGQRLGGFVGGTWCLEGKQALAWGWSGGWRRWQCESEAHMGTETWNEIGAVGGHSGAIKSVCWSPGGEYLISAGLDQTTRIHGAIPIEGTNLPSWHELSRPQVHGYDLLGAAFIDSLKFVSIADEKVARVFEAPMGFINIVEGLSVAKFAANESERPLGARVPTLGLSNKAIAEVNPMDGVASLSTKRRPFEGELAAMTLWPETEKIFGHGYESISLGVSNTHKFIATACKASTTEHAVARIYDTASWQPVGKPLAGHSLTITRIVFSPDDRLVITVSRDRSWRLFVYQDPGGKVKVYCEYFPLTIWLEFVPIAADKSHSRIIWDCSWAHERNLFATASRDKTVKIWHPTDTNSLSKWGALSTIKTSDAATAVAFCPTYISNRFFCHYRKQTLGSHPHLLRYRLAVGLESGDIILYSAPNTDIGLSSWRADSTLNSRYCVQCLCDYFNLLCSTELLTSITSTNWPGNLKSLV